ncbi:MAG: RnfH family protein [Magnetococcales bacterium]|nr:RnfH family protein [Magnetococcales bacterium]
MNISVTYADVKHQVVLELTVAAGTSVEKAIHQSGILNKFTELDLSKNKVGIYGKLVTLEQIVSEGDRIEIYRPAIGKPPKKGTAAKGEGTETDEAAEEVA